MLVQTYLSFFYNTFSSKSFRLGNYPSCEVVSWKPFCGLSSITKNTIFCLIKPILIHPCFICINTIFITNTVMHTFNAITFNLPKTIFVGKEIPEWCSIIRSWKCTWNLWALRTSKLGWLRPYQELPTHLWHKTLQKLGDIDTNENIYSIQACIYRGCYNITPKDYY